MSIAAKTKETAEPTAKPVGMSGGQLINFHSRVTEVAKSVPVLSEAKNTRLDTDQQRAERSFPDYRGKRIGPFRIEHVLGMGGMGTVYLAIRDDDEFKMKVALKLINQGMDNKAFVSRFLHERQILADLSHPNIARLIDGGTTEEGLPYLAMEYVEGEPIDIYCKREKLDIRQRLELFNKVCAAVHFIHGNNVVHRDIKPGNILVTKDGEPRILDFGIAKILDDSADRAMTYTANNFLTPEYASPEQILGQSPQPKNDIYALGILLYELLTGKMPYGFENRSMGEIHQVICNQEPVKPSQQAVDKATMAIGPSVRRPGLKTTRQTLDADLDAIILKALRKEPACRYATLEDFSDDIKRYLEGYPVKARGKVWRYKAGKHLRRHKWQFAALTGFATLILGFYFYTCCIELESNKEGARLKVLAELAELRASESARLVELERNQARHAESQKVAAERETNKVQGDLERTQLERDQALLAKEREAIALKEKAALARKLKDMEREKKRLALVAKTRMSTLPISPRPNNESAIATVPEATRIVTKEEPQISQFLEKIFGDADGAPVTVAQILNQKTFGWSGPESDRAIAQAKIMNLTGAVYVAAGRYAEAKPLFEQSLELKRSMYGSEHEAVAMALGDLGYLHFLEGRHQIAEKLYQQALDIRHKLNGEKHVTVAASLNQFALLRQGQGDYQQAWSLFKESLEMRLNLLGEKDPVVAESVGNMAGLFWVLGDKEKAVSLQQMALRIFRDAYGNNSDEVAICVRRLEYFLSDLKGEKLETIHPLAQWRDLLGSEDSTVATSALSLAQSLDPGERNLSVAALDQGPPPPPSQAGGGNQNNGPNGAQGNPNNGQNGNNRNRNSGSSRNTGLAPNPRGGNNLGTSSPQGIGAFSSRGGGQAQGKQSGGRSGGGGRKN